MWHLLNGIYDSHQELYDVSVQQTVDWAVSRITPDRTVTVAANTSYSKYRSFICVWRKLWHGPDSVSCSGESTGMTNFQ
jgi:hypothetical protein